MTDDTRWDISAALAAVVERAGAYTATVHARRAPASGIVWAARVVLTSDHTLERDDDIAVTLPDGRELPAAVAGRDPRSDVAVLWIDVDVDAAPAPRATLPRIGQLALAVGRGLHGVGASLGIVSSIDRPRRGHGHGRGGTALDRVIHADATMYPDFSGGPLVDAQGAILGVNCGGVPGQGFTIPTDMADGIARQLLTHGRLKRAYLGLHSQPARLPATLAAAAGQPTGLVIVGIMPGSPAEQAGLQVGDILLALDGWTLGDTDDLRRALTPERVEQRVLVRIARGGSIHTLETTIKELRTRAHG